MENNVSKKELKDIIESTSNPVIKNLGKQKIQDEFKGDEVAQKMIQLSQLIAQSNTTQGVDENEVKRIVREQIENEKISFDNLDDTIKSLLNNQPTTVTIKINEGGSTKVVQQTISASAQRPLIQLILSDVLARNNVYLYGGAGTGKTYSAGIIQSLLDWELIEVNCNQFTSSLELIGGQTIDGYQEGKVIRAFGNLKEDGTPMDKKGCILLLDELPKIDPNTAGILNSVLARVGEYTDDGKPKPIQNAKGEKIERGNCFIIATGNSLLNTKDAEYEANYKQDLSLQDRFVGSTYQVFVDEVTEWNIILKQKWAFIFIFLTRLRKIIEEEGFTSKAFVSVRLMMSVQKTYNVFRAYQLQGAKSHEFTADKEVSYTPAVKVEGALNVVKKQSVKTVKTTMDEFFSLFTDDQATQLKEKVRYDEWLDIVKQKNKLPLDKLNTDSELEEIKNYL